MTAGGGVGLMSAQEIADKHCQRGNYEHSDVLDAISEALRQKSAAIAELLATESCLLEALVRMTSAFSPTPRNDTEGWREEHEACEIARAAIQAATARRASALAALEESK